jgi:choice-of-anchor B domain-containing protein
MIPRQLIAAGLFSAGLCCALAAPLSAHDGDLKLLYKKPGFPGTGFTNASLQSPQLLLGRQADDPRAGPSEAQRLALSGFPAYRVTLLSWLTLSDFGVPGGGNGNSLTGYTSPGGRRYALMGLSTGTAFVDITVPNNPVIVTQRPGPQSLWRDIRTFQHYAYAVSEGGSGIQVFDMSQIDAGIVTQAATILDGGTAATHTVAINQASGYLYRSGGGTNGLRIYDLNPDPAHPALVATWSNMYVHEVSVFSYTSGPYAGREIAFACSGLNGGFTQTGLRILDVTNKANIVQLGSQLYPNAQFCHQGWLSEDGHYFYVDDEFWNGPQTTIVVDVSDLSNPTFVTTFSTGSTSAAHNLYVNHDRIYESNYKSGLYVWDISQDPLSPTTYAYFDTSPEDDADTYNSLWNNYAFFDNNVVIGSDIEKGLFVWYVGDPLLTFSFPSGTPDQLDTTGETVPVHVVELVPGDYQPGTATLHYDAGAGFVSVPMTDLGGLDFGAPFPALACGTQVNWYVSGSSTDNTVWIDPPSAPLSTYVSTVATSVATPIADDFETDTGWTTSVAGATAGQWERGVPVDDPAWDYDPASDSDGSGQCWLTQNQLGNTDVDDGSVTLMSPTIDMTGGTLAIRYDYFLRLTVVDGSDMLRVEIDENDGAGPWVEVARHDTDGGLSWRSHTITQADLDAAGVTPTATMRLRFTAVDAGTQSIVEAGLDGFRVETLSCSATPSFCDASDGSLASCPCANPGSPDTGCDIQQGTGGVRLDVVAQETSPQNRVTATGVGYPAGTSPASVVIRAAGLDPAAPVVFGDGLRCVGTPLVRLGATVAANGTSTHTFGHGAGAGDFYYQLWFRNEPAMYCTPDAFNLSNGRRLSW